jgi:hypothetical protein
MERRQLLSSIMIANNSELKIAANKGELGKLIPLTESIKVKKCVQFIQ